MQNFSGGIDMVLGVAQLYGIEMMPNFRQPYFSTSLGDFWRRWHISLGAWMRDYLFYPFALTKPMQRFGKWATSHWGKHFGRVLPAAVANLLVFAVVGIWHGPQAHYLAWGLALVVGQAGFETERVIGLERLVLVVALAVVLQEDVVVGQMRLVSRCIL